MRKNNPDTEFMDEENIENDIVKETLKKSIKAYLIIGLIGLVIIASVVSGGYYLIVGRMGSMFETTEKPGREIVVNASDEMNNFINKATETFVGTPNSDNEANENLDSEAQIELEEIRKQMALMNEKMALMKSSPPPPPNSQTAGSDQIETLEDRRLQGGLNKTGNEEIPESLVAASLSSKSSHTTVHGITNMDYMLIKGTKIPCTLETLIISELPGFTGCVIHSDVYSANGRVLLIEKGSKLSGFYDRGLLNGEIRVAAIWDRIVTPFDLAIQLDSPTAGPLGAVGMETKVDNRWGLRIGSALMISLLDDAVQIQADKAREGSNAEVVIESNTADTSKDIANKVLNKNIDLPPIGYGRPGDIINVIVAKDIDMSSVYKVEDNG